MSHAPSAFGAALVVWLWDRDRDRRTPPGFLAPRPRPRPRHVPALAERGAAAPARRATSSPRGARARRLAPARRSAAAALAAGALAGAFPQMAAWKAIYGEWVLPTRRTAPTSSGSTIPSCWRRSSPRGTACSRGRRCSGWVSSGFARSCAAARRSRFPCCSPLVLMTYVNMCSGDWWAGGSFSNRRFDSLLPDPGLRPRRGPRRGSAALVAPAGARAAALVVAARSLERRGRWNGVRARGRVPRDARSPFPTGRGRGAQRMADAAGSPPTWPASWLFAVAAPPAAGTVRPPRGPLPLLSPEQPGGPRRRRRARRRGPAGRGLGRRRDRATGCAARPLRGRARLLRPAGRARGPRRARARAAPTAGATVARQRERPRRPGASARGRGWSAHGVRVGRGLLAAGAERRRPRRRPPRCGSSS